MAKTPGWYTVTTSAKPTGLDKLGCDGLYIESIKIHWWHPGLWRAMLGQLLPTWTEFLSKHGLLGAIVRDSRCWEWHGIQSLPTPIDQIGHNGWYTVDISVRRRRVRFWWTMLKEWGRCHSQFQT